MSAPESARLALRRLTADQHTELDTVLSRTDFDDRRSYATFLLRQAGPLFALEEAIDASGLPALFSDWPQRRRSRAIRQDLQRLEMPTPAPMRASLAGDDRLLGALYVLEGSRLGAKFLVRQARASRDPQVREATAYLAHGDGVAFWPTYLVALARREGEGLDLAALIEGARDAFAMFLEAATTRSIDGDALRAASA